MSTLRRAPVSRVKVLVGAVLAAALLGGLVAGAEWLRPGAGRFGTITPELDSDPRVEVRCAEPPAREGLRPRAESGRRARPVHSADLYDCPTTWDGRAVRFRGEVVGGVLQRGEHSWIQVNDDVYAGGLGPLPSHRELRGGNAGVGVLVPTHLVGRLQSIGGPGVRGDVVEVVGTYHRVDQETREVAIIRAGRLSVLREGGPVQRAVDRRRVIVAAVSTAVSVLLLGLQWRVRRRRFG